MIRERKLDVMRSNEYPPLKSAHCGSGHLDSVSAEASAFVGVLLLAGGPRLSVYLCHDTSSTIASLQVRRLRDNCWEAIPVRMLLSTRFREGEWS